MSNLSLPDLSKRMKEIDFAMLFTHGAGGAMAGRPMSNNGDVDYDGDSYFFTDENAHLVAQIERDSNVGLSFSGTRGIIGQRPLFIAVEGKAELIRDRTAFESHWTSQLDRWFENGPDTPGIVLIKVHASRLHYWEGTDHGEIEL